MLTGMDGHDAPMLLRTTAPLLGLGFILGFALCGSLVWSLQPQTLGHHWYDTFDDHAPEWLVAAFTFFLFVSTTLLWRSTVDLYKAGERQFLATFRPRLAVREVAWIPSRDGVTLTIENVGGNPCTIVESEFLLRSGDPDGRVLRPHGKNEIQNVTLAIGEFHDHIHMFDTEDESFEAGFLAPGSLISGATHAGLILTAFFMGTIVYEDPLKTRRRMSLLRVSDGRSIRFMRTQHPEDEYNDQ